MNENFLTAYKIKSIFLVHEQRVFILLACLFKEKNIYKVSACFFEVYIYPASRKNFVLDSLHKRPHTATKIPLMYSFSGDSAASALISTFMCL
jgi:hypothetical protein